MKILFIHTLYTPHIIGGAELTLQTLVEGLASRDVEPVVLTTADQPGLHKDEVNGVRVWRAGLRNIYWHFRKKRPAIVNRRIWHSLDIYNPLMSAHLRRIIKLEQPDVASCHNLPGWSVSAWTTLTKQAVPIVQVLHDQYLLCPASTMFKSGRNCARQCRSCHLMRFPHPRLSQNIAAVVGVSRFVLDHHRTMNYFEGVPIQRVIHNARSPRALGILVSHNRKPNSEGPLRFGFIGTLAPNKGIESLLRVFENQPIPGAELWIAGRGHTMYEAALKNQSNDNAIRFIGRVKPQEFYPVVDVVIVPSLWNDTFPGVVLEALAFGKPVIGARRGGIPEMINDGVNGLLVEPNRPDELVEAMQRLATDRALRMRMGEKARASAAPFLDQEAWVSQYLAIYSEVIRGPIDGATDPVDNSVPQFGKAASQ